MAHYDSHQTIQKFFSETNRISKILPIKEFPIESSPLLSILRPYQLETVKWMITREMERTSFDLNEWTVCTPLGGILADEMGLGKTVEMLACILGNPKEKKTNCTAETDASLQMNSTVSSTDCSQDTIDESDISSQMNDTELTEKEDMKDISNSSITLDSSSCPSESFLEEVSTPGEVSDSRNKKSQKRKQEDFENSPILKKRPAVSAIKINRTMKKQIKELLKDYFDKFKRYCIRKHSVEESLIPLLDTSFKVVLLNRFYNVIKDHYCKQQTWGFLLTEFHVDDAESIGRSVLEKETKREDEEAIDDCSNDNITIINIISYIDEFLTEKMMAKFEKDFRNILAYSLHIAPGDDTVLFDGDDVACKCGSDKAQGKKIMCSKCSKFQHLRCVGLDYTFNKFNDYICPYCWIKLDLIESSATLIVIPSTLTLQWKQEIKKHARNCNLKVHIYEGVSKDYMLPNMLASYDIVIVSFETLRAEFNYASEVVDKNQRSLRHTKRYSIFGSPLTCISWWRLCIDEAQTVETVNTVSEMVSHLKATYRWAMTGTPIGNSLKDLYGLITYLGVEPFCESYSKYFEGLLYGDQSCLHTLFAYLMRRNTKDGVREQLKLPDLKTEVNWLSFTPVEGYFYQYTHSMTEKLFMQKIMKINNLDQRLSKASRQSAESVLSPLVTLRQACVHPQAVHKEAFNLSKISTMEKLLEQLIKKTKVECEDILRFYIMNIHGAAGVKIHMGQFAEAVSLYRMVLSKIKEFEPLTIDNFQVIHAKHNLYETAARDESINLTPDEQKIPEQIEELEQKYIERRREPVAVLMQTVNKHSNEIGNYLKDFRLASFDWWAKMFIGLDFDETRTKIIADLDKMNLTLDNIRVILSTSNRLCNALQYWLAQLEDKRLLTYSFLEKITKDTQISTLCESAVECHLRQSDVKKACLLCKMESTMMDYENILFNGKMKKKQNTNDENSNPLNWNMSAYECVLTGILNHARSVYAANSQIITRAVDHLKVLSLLKREFKTIRATWTKQCDLVHSYDEVDMAKSRFDAVCGTTDKLDSENPLYQGQFDTYEAASIVEYSKLQSKLGSLHYLINLEKSNSDPNITNECCPVCQSSADERRGVMSCGHFTCCLCMITLIKRSNGNEIHCPICRNVVLIKNVTYVYGGGNTNVNAGDYRGNYSVKIGAITSKVLSLKKNEPGIKILIFSTWDKVLDVIGQAFKENGIKYQRFVSGRKQKSCMKMFQENQEVTALLIRLKCGGKGLNLTEASHIIFAEPVLSVADEKQAIGRIDRLGQTKDMVVHKFIMKSTIEQHLLEMNEGIHKNDSEACELTFKDLKDLFIASANDIEKDNYS